MKHIRQGTLGALAGMILSAGAVHAADELKLIQGLTPAGSSAAMFLAKEKGWYDEADLDVSISEGRGSGYATQLVVSGEIDIGAIDLGPAMIAYEKGAPVVAIASWARKPTLSIFVDKDSPAESLADLKGKRIGLLAAGPVPPLIEPLMANLGVSRDDFTWVNVEPRALFGSYFSGQVDAMATIGPFAWPIVEPKRASKVFDLSDYGISSPGSGFIVSEATLAAKKDALTRFVATQIRAWNYIFDGNAEEAADAIIAQNPNAKLNRAVLLGQIEAYEPYFTSPATEGKPYGWQAPEDWKSAFETYQAAGLIERATSGEDYYTNEIVDGALELLE